MARNRSRPATVDDFKAIAAHFVYFSQDRNPQLKSPYA